MSFATGSSDAYPYLAVAHRFDLPYGTVLAYADARRKELLNAHVPNTDLPFDVWEVRAIRVLSKRADLAMIDATINREVRRTLKDKGAKLEAA